MNRKYVVRALIIIFVVYAILYGVANILNNRAAENTCTEEFPIYRATQTNFLGIPITVKSSCRLADDAYCAEQLPECAEATLDFLTNKCVCCPNTKPILDNGECRKLTPEEYDSLSSLKKSIYDSNNPE